MSRSRKKVCYPNRNSGSMRFWRRTVNKRMRAMSKQTLFQQDWDNLLMPLIDEAGNTWDAPTYRPSWSPREFWSVWRQDWSPGEDYYRAGFRK